MVMTSCMLSVNSIQSMVALCIHHAVDQGVLVTGKTFAVPDLEILWVFIASHV